MLIDLAKDSKPWAPVVIESTDREDFEGLLYAAIREANSTSYELHLAYSVGRTERGELIYTALLIKQ